MDVENDVPIIAKIGEGIEAEARGNCWSFSLTRGQAKDLTTRDVVYFLQAVILVRERQIIEQFGRQHPMLFYCWFDQQAAQLRFSLVSASYNHLPFGSEIHIETDLARIVEQFLSSPYPDGIPFEEFAPASDTQCPVIHTILPVWATQIPRAET